MPVATKRKTFAHLAQRWLAQRRQMAQVAEESGGAKGKKRGDVDFAHRETTGDVLVVALQPALTRTETTTTERDRVRRDVIAAVCHSAIKYDDKSGVLYDMFSCFKPSGFDTRPVMEGYVTLDFRSGRVREYFFYVGPSKRDRMEVARYMIHNHIVPGPNNFWDVEGSVVYVDGFAVYVVPSAMSGVLNVLVKKGRKAVAFPFLIEDKETSLEEGARKVAKAFGLDRGTTIRLLQTALEHAEWRASRLA